ncbi:MAG: alkaline phosphatase family protein, partial [Rubrobacter sp.]|nr:alkaline phosphatase family protein [Rubrobacter sp.]
MTDLVLGPLLRYVGAEEATVWVETSEPCEVEILGHRSRTFSMEGHHYALVVITGLEPGAAYEYEVLLDGERRWPESDSHFPPSVIRTIRPGEDLRLIFGSCRLALPHHPPYTLGKDEDERGREIDALHALALRMRDEPIHRWPHAMMMLGDQVYADMASPATKEFIRSRRDFREPPGEEVADFEEYTHLYRDSWSVPEIRWLLSTVSTAMIFDDHEIQDNWNGSHLWYEKHRQKPWWDEKMGGALSAYWIYQHLGNLSPAELQQDDLWPQVKDSSEAGPILREMSLRVADEPDAYRFSFYRDLGNTRLIVMDSRAGRQLEPGNRRMIHDADWNWIVDHSSGDFDHLLFATSIPLLMGHGIHHAETFNDAMCSGAWGEHLAKANERLRDWQNLGHWSAFPESFERFTDLLRSVAAGERGAPPASIAVLSGDVHHAYLAKARFPSEPNATSPVYQAVCSPMRNPLDSKERRVMRFAWSRPGKLLFRALARAAGVEKASIDWSLLHGEPWFNNQVAA